MSDEKREINVTSINQRGGITAYEVNMRTKPKPRSLTSQTETYLEEVLEQFGGMKIDVVAVMGDQEAYQFAQEIWEFLDVEGYDAGKGISQAVFNQPVMGQVLEPQPDGKTVKLIIGARE